MIDIDQIKPLPDEISLVLKIRQLFWNIVIYQFYFLMQHTFLLKNFIDFAFINLQTKPFFPINSSWYSTLQLIFTIKVKSIIL